MATPRRARFYAHSRVPLVIVKQACKTLRDEGARDFFVHLCPGKVTSSRSNATVEAIGTELNATEICYPGTTLRLVSRPIRSSIFPPGQDV